MKKSRKPAKPLCVLLAAMLALLLPFQAFAYAPSIIAQILPEAVAGAAYQHQLHAVGFGRYAVWSAEGLPDGLELDPAKGILSGTAREAGTFEVLVTVQSRWKIRPKTDTKRFLLHVSLPTVTEPDSAPDVPSTPEIPPPAVDVPEASSVPAASPQAATIAAEADNDAEILAMKQNLFTWLSVQANGKSGAETTTELYLTFSGEVVIHMDICVDIADGQAISISSAEITEEGYRYTLGITLDEAVKNDDKVTVTLEGVDYLEPNLVTMEVQVYVATDASLIDLTLDELVPELLLGSNASADEITTDLVLPAANTEYACEIAWRSEHPEIISNAGAVTRPAYSEGNRTVALTATATRGGKSAEKDFSFLVLARDPEIIPAPPDNTVETPPVTYPSVAVPESSASSTRSNSETTGTSVSAAIQTSTNVDKNGALSRMSIVNELQAVLQDMVQRVAVVRAKNAQSISPKTLKALAAAATAEGKQAVLFADTLTQIRKVDARLYITPASLTAATEPIKLGIATKGDRPETVKRFFEKHFDNAVSVISCEQQGGFGAKLQIAAKVQLPEDTASLVFYSYNAETNSFTRILTAYRIDANGYLRFATELAGDIIVSNGALKKR